MMHVIEIITTEGAPDDLKSICEFISDTDSKQKADYALNHLEAEILSLKDLPNRGVYPKELIELGIKEYREIFLNLIGLFIVP